GDFENYLVYVDKRMAIESKAELKALTAIYYRAYIPALQEGGDFKTYYHNLINTVDPEIMLEYAIATKASVALSSQTTTIAGLNLQIVPVIDRGQGKVSLDIIYTLLSQSANDRYFNPNTENIYQVLGNYIDQHQADVPEKQNIFANVEINKEDGEEVIVAIMDSGTDLSVFDPSNRWVNNKEIPNDGIDNDNNGYIDDVNGIAYTYESDKTTELLFPILDYMNKDQLEQTRKISIGMTDLFGFNKDTEESDLYRQVYKSLSTPEQLEQFSERISLYSSYSHGTHTAGIAAEGNALIKLMVARVTFGHKVIPPMPTLEGAIKDNKAFEETIQYFKDNGVRVVNMSFGGSLADTESALEQNGVSDPKERKALARKIFDIGKNGMEKALRNAPDIHFVIAAGNSNNNNEFDEEIPSMLNLPNVTTVGAVDMEGNIADFTTTGKVEIYANGEKVVSYVPGGKRVPQNGTSMACPNVVQVIAKMLTQKPELTVQEQKEILLGTAFEKNGLKLINPAAAIQAVRD
ncbi:MAG: S8 family serine peptidase, partial [Deltaproteobacteria bacterium]|nr:S8 family serine peptidase [Deltaproteobacteria bacterium]